MQQIIDPRTRGFNYGPGWGREPKPASYYLGEHIAFVLRQQANRIGKQAWSLDMALRNVRLASEPLEKVQAVTALEIELAKFILHTH